MAPLRADASPTEWATRQRGRGPRHTLRASAGIHSSATPRHLRCGAPLRRSTSIPAAGQPSPRAGSGHRAGAIRVGHSTWSAGSTVGRDVPRLAPPAAAAGGASQQAEEGHTAGEGAQRRARSGFRRLDRPRAFRCIRSRGVPQLRSRGGRVVTADPGRPALAVDFTPRGRDDTPVGTTTAWWAPSADGVASLGPRLCSTASGAAGRLVDTSRVSPEPDRPSARPDGTDRYTGSRDRGAAMDRAWGGAERNCRPAPGERREAEVSTVASRTVRPPWSPCADTTEDHWARLARRTHEPRVGRAVQPTPHDCAEPRPVIAPNSEALSRPRAHHGEPRRR